MEEPPVVAIRSEGWNDFVNDLRRRPSELLPVFAKGIKITRPWRFQPKALEVRLGTRARERGLRQGERNEKRSMAEIAFNAPLILYELSSLLSAQVDRGPWISGGFFAALVYGFMSFIDIPLSAYPLTISFGPRRIIEGVISHVVLFSLPSALVVRRYTVGRMEAD